MEASCTLSGQAQSLFSARAAADSLGRTAATLRLTRHTSGHVSKSQPAAHIRTASMAGGPGVSVAQGGAEGLLGFKPSTVVDEVSNSLHDCTPPPPPPRRALCNGSTPLFLSTGLSA